MNIEDIQRVLVVGAGTMGQQIALQCATHGYTVNLYDIAQPALEAAMTQMKAYASQFETKGCLTSDQVNDTLNRIFTTNDPVEAAIEADLISESVPEDPQLKGEVFAQFHNLCPPRTIFTTNTSTLVPSMFAEATGRPAQFVALHFHQPVWIANVVDIMAHPKTSQETVALIYAFAKRIGQIPIVLKKESPSYVFNAMLGAFCGEAINLALQGVVSVEDIDRAWMGIMKMPIGPFGILDAIGLDLVWNVSSYWATALDDPKMQTNANFLKEYVDKGHLGVKSRKGFYTYPEPAFQQSGFVKGE